MYISCYVLYMYTVQLTVNIFKEYVPGAHVMMSSLEVVDGQAHPAKHVIHSDIPMGLYVPKVHREAMVGGAVVTGQE